MRRALTAALLPALLLAGPLSGTKEELLRLDRKKAQTEASKLATSWINPVMMRYTRTEGDQYPDQLAKTFTISVDQPIFKSLGIWEAIKYARAKRGESLRGVELRKKELIAALYRAAYTIKKLDLAIQKQRLALANARLDVRIKQEQYESGELDAGFLDDALLKKNSAALALLGLKEQLAAAKKELKDLSDLEAGAIRLPRFELLSKERFLSQNLELARAEAAKEAARHFKNMTISRYLPELSLLYSYNYQNLRGSLYFPGYTYNDHYSTYGFRLQMPLFDINAFKNIESTRLDYLKSAVTIADKRRELQNLYEATRKRLRVVDEKIALAKEDARLYERLERSTLDGVRAGEKTEFDLQIIKNSLAQKRLDIKIYEIDRQLLLLDLYKRLADDAL